MGAMFEVVQGNVVVMTLHGGSAVVCIAVSETMAHEICDALKVKQAEKLIDGVF